MNHLFSHLCLAAVLILSAQSSIPVALGADEEIGFDRDIRPILEQHCRSCHSAEAHQSGLVVDTLEALLKRGCAGWTGSDCRQQRRQSLGVLDSRATASPQCR